MDQPRHAQPVRYQWYYYDSARFPSTSPSTDASVLDTISSDVKDALHQLQALRTTQNKTINRLTKLERVIGVFGRRADNAAPKETIVQHLASIQSAIELLARTSRQEAVVDPCHRNITPQSGAQSPPAIPTSASSSEKQHGLFSPPLESSCSPPLDFVTTHEPSVGTSTEPATQCDNNFTRRTPPLSHHGREAIAGAPSPLDPPSSGPTDASSVTRVQIQTSPSQTHLRGTNTEGVDYSMSLSSDPPAFSAPSVLCPSSSTTVALGSGPGTLGSDSDQPYSNSEDAQMAFRADCDDSPVTNIGAESGSLVQRCHQKSSGLASRLPTPPSKASIDYSEPRVVSALPRNRVAATGPTIHSHPCPLLKLPVIMTPPSLTPEPSEEARRGGPTSVCSGLPSPLTPMLTSYTVDGVPASRQEIRAVSKEMRARELTEERGDPLDNAEDGASEGPGGGAPVADSPTSDANAGLPVITVTSEPLPKLNSSHISRDVEPSPTSRLPPGQRQTELPEDAPGTSKSDPEYIRFSSLANFTSAPPSRYATPSESTGGLPTQDEDEVWRELMLDASGMSTPAVGTTSLPLMASNQSSRASPVHPDTSQLLSGSMPVNDVGQDHSLFIPAPAPYAIDPSVLHDPPLEYHELPSSPLTSDSSLSSLTSIADSDDVGRDGLPSPASSPVTISCLRATSEATLVDGRARLQPFLGGSCASLDELTVLARRAPPKIFLKLPRVLSSLKRKRDNMDHEGKGEMHVEVAARSASSIPTLNVSLGGSTSNPPASDVEPSVSHKRLKKPHDLGEHGTSRKKARPSRRMKPLSHITHHVQNGRMVSVNAIAEPESQAPPSVPASVIPSGPESSVRTGRPGQGSRASAQRRKRNGRGNQTKASSAAPDHRVGLSLKKDEVCGSIRQHSGAWPEFPSQFEHWHLQFIQCDNCDHWYHYGCAGIVIDDPRLLPGAYFGCPPCHTQNYKRRTTRRHENVCKRPDCPQSGITGDTEVYYIERLVGRKRTDHATYLWLAKWDGYPMSEATWIPRENVVGNGTGMFDAFAEDALEEGADLSQDLLLLQEALDAGFGAGDV